MTTHRPVHQGLRGAVSWSRKKGSWGRCEGHLRSDDAGTGRNGDEGTDWRSIRSGPAYKRGSQCVGCLFLCSTHVLRASNTVTSTTCTSAFLISEPVARCLLVASGPGMQLLRQALLSLVRLPTLSLLPPAFWCRQG